MTSNQTEHQENSAQHTNAINNLIRQKKENNAADTNITYSQRELKENNAQDTNVRNRQTELKENSTAQTIKQNSKKTMHAKLT